MLFALILVEVVANRSLPALVSSFLTFDEQSYWYRLVIWHYGSQAALDHPLFGVGLNDWERPSWMGPSIDNFWLYLAIRAGLPAPVLLHLALLSVFIPLATKKITDERLISYRTGFLIAISAIYLVSWTVHFWDTAYVVLFFLMGSSAWMLNGKATRRIRSTLFGRPVPV